MEVRRLQVIPPPPEHSVVLEQNGSDKGRFPFFSHDDMAGPILYACGNPNCDMIMLDRPIDEAMNGIKFLCPRCNTYNQAVM